MTVFLVWKGTSVRQMASRHLGQLSSVTMGLDALKAQIARPPAQLTTATVLSQQESSWLVLSGNKEYMLMGTGTVLTVKPDSTAHLEQKQYVLLVIIAKQEKVLQFLALLALTIKTPNRLTAMHVILVQRDSLVLTQGFLIP